ncbi:P-loop containing nucleoside triphosphate hydrolase protein [Auriscalpium vulgare]|uniref:P-loop containing nucleoside triphosphate hydrolase protein n=1 Tax=Auriscalpium vulgare TaxID=40419 RepID=A0ACB8RXU2_9AGAM|nr:P-loop containing nucleoside triphosphate hydrolase protein [Auriscalpium vulgare]
MSSDGYFDDDLDAAFFQELDAIEATHIAGPSAKQPAKSPPRPAKNAPAAPNPDDSDYFDLTFDVDETELQKLDSVIEDAYRNPPAPPARARSFTRVPSKGRQTTLFGDVLPEAGPSSKAPRQPMQRTKSSTTELFRKTKKWDQTAFAKSGAKRRKSVKGKEKASPDDEEEDEPVEFEQFPAPFVSRKPPPPMKLKPDMLHARTWVFPLNRPKRDYQFNISKHCLFDNTLVALPTGLGKTFIAGVVMLNFYRWFPGGKVIFVAPTKPLVAQQIDACHKTCGIPGRDAVELTGNNPKPFRAKAWQEKRVFYMTPQTLENDLKSGTGDPQDVVLLVIDEAHKGTGEYAYAKVVRYLMAKNPHFRVLALTATPGSTPDAVQAIIDSLHISRIEIRDERSLDIRSYVNEKKIEQHIISMNEEISKLRDMLAVIMKGLINKLASTGLLKGNPDPVMFHPFRAQVAMGEVHHRPDARQLSWTFPYLKKVGALARAMGYLLEASPQMCHTSLTAEAESSAANSNGKGGGNALSNDPNYRAFMNELKAQKSRGFAIHPKMEKLKMLVINHFTQRASEAGADPGQESAATGDDTRVMVFVSFREAVDEIVEFLNQESPLIRATKFIGQGTDKQGKKGFAQREQLETIKCFKDGAFNVLVSTSIGEEGLDIGEIDMIVCYEAQKTPIRMLQRVGRTGRKREGYVHVLLAEGREELNWNKAQEAYSDVQQSIVRGEQLEFYADVERLLPDSVKPECVEMVMEIEEYDRAATEKTRTAASPGKGAKKRKRNDDAGRNMPAGASTGFVTVADLLRKQGGTKKRKKDEGTKENAAFTVEDLAVAGCDDEDDEAIEAGPLAAPRRTASTPAVPKKKSTKAKVKRASTMVETAKKTKAKKKSKAKQPSPEPEPEKELTLSQFERQGAEDSDDMEIEKGLWASPPRRSVSQPERSPTPDPLPSPPRFSSPDVPLSEQTFIDICSPSSSQSPSTRHLSSSPERPLSHLTASRSRSTVSLDKSPVTPDRSSTASSHKNPMKKANGDLAWLLADSDDAGAGGSSPPRPSQPSSPRAVSVSDDIEIVRDVRHDDADDDSSILVLASSPDAGPSTQARKPSHLSALMPPPAELPARFVNAAELVPPEPTCAVRPAGRIHKRKTVTTDLDSSPLRTPPLSQRRLHRFRDPTPPNVTASPPPRRAKKLKIRDTAAAKRANHWIDVEASHSGDEVSGGSSDADREEMEDSDRDFLNEGSLTQVSPSYDQFAAYRQSLLSQAPGSSRAPAFAAPPLRRGGAYRAGLIDRNPRRVVNSSSPARQDDPPDEYMFGSFVVDDDAEISYVQSSDPGI